MRIIYNLARQPFFSPFQFMQTLPTACSWWYFLNCNGQLQAACSSWGSLLDLAVQHSITAASHLIMRNVALPFAVNYCFCWIRLSLYHFEKKIRYSETKTPTTLVYKCRCLTYISTEIAMFLDSPSSVTNPATGKVIASVPNMGAEDAENAIQVAFRAFQAWREVTAKVRISLFCLLIPQRCTHCLPM